MRRQMFWNRLMINMIISSVIWVASAQVTQADSTIEITGPIEGTTIYQSVLISASQQLPSFAIVKGLPAQSTTVEMFLDGSSTPLGDRSAPNGRNTRVFVPTLSVGSHTLVAKAIDRSTSPPRAITSDPVHFSVAGDPNGPLGLRCHVQSYYRTNGQARWVNASVFLVTDPAEAFVGSTITEDQKAELKCSLKTTPGDVTQVRVLSRRAETEAYALVNEYSVSGALGKFSQLIESNEEGVIDYVVETRRGADIEQTPSLKIRFIKPRELPIITSPTDGSRITTNSAVPLVTNVIDDSSLDRVCLGKVNVVGLDPCVSSPPYQLSISPGSFPTQWIVHLAILNIYGHTYAKRDASFTNGIGIVSTRLIWSMPANDVPVVRGFSSPTSTKEFTVGDSIEIIPQIVWGDGTPDHVDILNGSTKLGLAVQDSASGLWIFRWVAPAPGSYSITTRAYNTRGASGEKGTLLKIGSKPTIEILHPVSGGIYSAPATIPIQVAATTDTSRQVARIEVWVNGTQVGSMVPPVHEFAWQAGAMQGTARLRARVIDTRGSSSETHDVLITLKQAPAPTLAVKVVEPLSGAVVDAEGGGFLRYSAESQPTELAKVEFILDGLTLDTISISGNTLEGKYHLPNLTIGEHNVRVRLTTADQEAVTSEPVKFVAALVPKVEILAPRDGAMFVGPADIPLSAAIKNVESPITKVEFFSDASMVAAATSKPYAGTWGSVPPGEYSITARATDAQGRTVISRSIRLRVGAIAVNVTSHQDDEIVYAKTIVIAGDYAGPIHSVAINGVVAKLGTRSFAAAVDVAPGLNELTVSATGDNGEAEQRTIRLLRREPELTILSPAPDSSTTDGFVTVTGTFFAPRGSGITVNGQIAAAMDNQFVMSVLPTSLGATDIRVVLSLIDGQVLEQSIKVTRTPGEGVGLVAWPQAGYAPVKIEFEAFEAAGGQNLPCCFAAAGLGQGLTRAKQYTEPGLHEAVLAVALMSGGKREITVPIISQDRRELDRQLRHALLQMFNQLRVARIQEALEYFTVSSRDQYKRAFLALGSDLGRIGDQMRAFVAGQVWQEFAEYIVEAETTEGVLASSIHFIKCEDGVWRIESL